jgi:hypothetical protein
VASVAKQADLAGHQIEANGRADVVMALGFEAPSPPSRHVITSLDP